MSTPRGYFKNVNSSGRKKFRRKDFEIMPGKIKAKSYKDRRGQTFTVRSYKLSGVHLHSISGSGKLPLLCAVCHSSIAICAEAHH